MTPNDKVLIEAYSQQKMSREKLLANYSIDLLTDKQYVITELEGAMKSKDSTYMEHAITLLYLSDVTTEFVDILNRLLVYPYHFHHQAITKFIQELKSPKSIAYIEKVLATNFDFLKYTASENGAIAKWFSWALYSIGTKESFDIIEKYSNSSDEGISNEMLYRLQKMSVDNS